MRNIFQTVISRGGYDLTGLLKNIDKYHVEGKLTDAERDELYAAARGGAVPQDSADLFTKVQELESRIAALEGKKKPAESNAEEYVPGKWYYTGNTVTFNGKTYSCIAPISVVCVWSPHDYPAYWEEVTV